VRGAAARGTIRLLGGSADLLIDPVIVLPRDHEIIDGNAVGYKGQCTTPQSCSDATLRPVICFLPRVQCFKWIRSQPHLPTPSLALHPSSTTHTNTNSSIHYSHKHTNSYAHVWTIILWTTHKECRYLQQRLVRVARR
jgi:hypothetical protein